MTNDEGNAKGISTLAKYVATERRRKGERWVGLQWLYSGSTVGLQWLYNEQKTNKRRRKSEGKL